MAEEKFLTRQEAVVRLGVSLRTLDGMVRTGRLTKHVRGVDKRTYLAESEIEELLKFKKAA